MATYLVTGGAGFIGSHLAEQLLRNGHAVRVLDNLSTGRAENLDVLREADSSGLLTFLKADIRDLAACQRACEGVEAIFHLAALGSVARSMQHPDETVAVNVLGTTHVLTAARDQRVRRVVFASSSSVYGDTEVLPKHEGMPTVPLSPYAASKLAGEEFGRVFAKSLGVQVVSLRYFNVFGPRQDPGSQYAAVIPLFITSMLLGQRPSVFGDGLQTRDFTYVANVVDATIRSTDRGPGRGEAINVACGERYSLLDLLGSLGQLLGTTPEPDFRPPRPGDVRHSQASIDRARDLLGFAPRTTFEEGLRRAVAAYRGRSA